jgi:hypothetical protein
MGTSIASFWTSVSNNCVSGAKRCAEGKANMWIEEVSPERSAEFFRYYQQALDVLRKGSDTTFPTKTTELQPNHLIAAACLTILGVSNKDEPVKSRPYFATPGEADWGC